MKKTIFSLLTLIIFSLSFIQIPSSQSADTPPSRAPIWDVNGWIYIEVIDDHGNELAVFDIDDEEIPIYPNSFLIGGVWMFENPLLYVIYDYELFDNVGYYFAVKNNNSNQIDLQISSYTKDEETKRIFEIKNLDTNNNVIDLDQLINNGNIKINENNHSAKKTDSRNITTDELMVKATSRDIVAETLGDLDNDSFSFIDGAQNNNSNSDDENKDLFRDIRSPILRDAVIYLYNRNIISGYPDGTFQPNNTINRAEALKIIFESRGITVETATNSGFPDVPAFEWYAKHITQAKKLGIIQGYSDGKYHPAQKVNKAEFIKITMLSQNFFEADDYNLDLAMNQFSDIQRNQWYTPYLAFALKKDLVDKSSRFYPSDGMTRGEAAWIIYKIVKYLE